MEIFFKEIWRQHYPMYISYFNRKDSFCYLLIIFSHCAVYLDTVRDNFVKDGDLSTHMNRNRPENLGYNQLVAIRLTKSSELELARFLKDFSLCIPVTSRASRELIYAFYLSKVRSSGSSGLKVYVQISIANFYAPF